MTIFPNIVGDTSLRQMETALPYFGMVLKSKCNPRIKSYVCNLLEPRCGSNRTAIPPCKKFCKVAKEGCSAVILQTFKLADVFKCQQFSDINENDKCTNLAKGKTCYSSEFHCPDDTCIPKAWVCDGIRDCKYAADESNCTSCTNNEFYCDMKCIPKTWRCDSLQDCRDGMDEYNCPHTPGGCQYGDFQCASGICIPRMWRCDGQNDCKDGEDGSDERDCGPVAGYV
ncbi:Atrial natriuretic peptide-converting enzyme [Nymphon striatum]|nr:Atrial natriuretic peptide-converting enzyme [Nymphon striatum]